MLLSFPEVIVNSILCEWLNVRASGRVDSAYCTRKERPKLFEIFRSPHFISDELFPANLKWLASRDVRVNCISGRSYFVFELLSQYLETNGNCVRKVTLSSRTSADEFVAIIAVHCRRLQSVEFNQAGPNVALLLQNNPDLEKVTFFSTGQESLNNLHRDFSTISLPKVHTVCVFQSNLRTDCALSLYKMFPNVTKLHVPYHGPVLHVPPETTLYVRLVALLPQLTTLSLQRCHLTDAILALVVRLCPGIIHLDVRDNDKMSGDDAILIAARGLKLHSIAFDYYDSITSRAFGYLAQYSADTLQAVSVLHNVTRSRVRYCTSTTYTVSRASIEQLKQACGDKVKFSWHTCPQKYITSYDNFPHTTAFTFNFAVTDEVLYTIAKQCWQLEQISVAPTDVHFTEHGLDEFMSKCAKFSSFVVVMDRLRLAMPKIAEFYPGLFVVNQLPNVY